MGLKQQALVRFQRTHTSVSEQKMDKLTSNRNAPQ